MKPSLVRPSPPRGAAIQRGVRPGRRQVLFRLAAILLAITPFALAELYLRSTAGVDPVDLSRDPILDVQAPALFVRRGDRWQIPPERLNFFRTASFPASKPTQTRRIFVLGGSTVQGRPYATETAFAQWLQFRLAAADPQHRYEVINCGGVSYASYRLALLLDEVLHHQPDAIVLYTGHNEFLEERSYGTLGHHRGGLGAIASRSALVRALQRWLPPARSPTRQVPSQLTTRLDVVDGMQRYRRDPRWRRAVVEHFRITLERMIRACRQAGTPLVICVPASEIVRTPPMKIETLALPNDQRQTFQAAWAAAREGGTDAAARLRACHACLTLDSQHAGAHYIAGRLHWQLGRSESAREHLIAARDHDVCPLRATTPIIEHTVALAEHYALPTVRCDRLLDQSGSQGHPLPDGICDPKWFADHVHPTIAGHQQIAAVLAERFAELWSFAPGQQSEARYRQTARAHLESLDEVYFSRGKQRLAGLLNWAAGRAGQLAVELLEPPSGGPPEP